MTKKDFAFHDGNDHLWDQAICWRGGSEAQAKRHIRRGETPCRACQDAANRASEDRTRRGSR